LIKTLRLAYGQRSLIISAEPPPGLNSPPPDELPTVSLPWVVPAYCMSPVRMWRPMQAIED
jgi:hypothetical protein